MSINSKSDWLHQNLFNSIPREKFFSDIQGKMWFHTRLTQEAINNLPTWDSVNLFLTNHRLSHPRVRMSREGATNEALTILRQRSTLRGELIFETLQNRIYDNLRLGSTLVLDAIDIAMPEVRRIASSLTSNFFVRTQTNGYVTFSESRGFGLHWDDHDVFIVQVHGNKTWHLYGNTRVAPMHVDFHDEHPQPTEILETVELLPGSLLYVPRGCWHDVVGHGEPTFHLTFGVTPPTGIDVLEWLKELFQNNEFVRQDIPLYQQDKQMYYLEKYRQIILEILEGDFISKFIDDVKRTSTAYPAFSLPFGVNDVNLPSEKDIISLIPSALNYYEEDDSLKIEANNLTWTLPKFATKLLSTLLVNEISVSESWRICCNGSDYSLEEWQIFLNDLIAQGLILIKTGK